VLLPGGWGLCRYAACLAGCLGPVAWWRGVAWRGQRRVPSVRARSLARSRRAAAVRWGWFCLVGTVVWMSSRIGRDMADHHHATPGWAVVLVPGLARLGLLPSQTRSAAVEKIPLPLWKTGTLPKTIYLPGRNRLAIFLTSSSFSPGGRAATDPGPAGCCQSIGGVR
jgi:hypothetical protein